jgi:hypothetical protein
MKKLGQTRGTFSETWIARQAVKNAPFAVKAWNAVGWVEFAVSATARGWLTAGEYARYQEEAQEATKQAEEMWRKALEDFEAYLKQKCNEEARATEADRERLERAKAAIEEWDNNQNLYWDPIKNEAVTFREALRRANEYLKSGKISQTSTHTNFHPAAYVFYDDPPSQNALRAAIGELDKAILSWGRLDPSISKYMQAQRSIEQKLDAAFGVSATPAKEPTIGIRFRGKKSDHLLNTRAVAFLELFP